MKTLKYRLSVFITTITLVWGTMCILLFSLLVYTFQKYGDVLDNFFEFTTLSGEISQASVSLEGYVQNQSPDTLDVYLSSIRGVNSSLQAIKQAATQHEIYYAAYGVEQLIESYTVLNDQIIEQLKISSAADVYPLLSESEEIYGYINIRLSALSKDQSHRSMRLFQDFSQSMKAAFGGIITVILILVPAILFYSLRLSKGIREPIAQLTDYAEKIALGRFDMADISLQSSSEIVVLTASLNKMKHEIQGMIDEIQEKSILEIKLSKVELENLKISDSLKSTEIQMLQAQINPHFLFNTLSSINCLAALKGDDRIVTLIESLSQMLRYSLQKIDRPVTLTEELENLRNYIYIQQVRFQDKLRFQLDLESQFLNIQIPCLTLQPLVENAIDHGLKPCDYYGEIRIHIFDENDRTIVQIQDDGVGMEEEILQAVSSFAYKNSNGKHSGIGFENVASRLINFCGSKDCISIESTCGEGTVVTVKLNRKEERGSCLGF